MKRNLLETYRLLIELKNEKIIPEKHEKDLDRCIRYLEEIIENDDDDKNQDKKTKFKPNLKIIETIAVIFKAYFGSP